MATPLEKLDDAVHEYVASLRGDGALAAWVVTYQLTKIVDEPDCLPLASRTDYTISPSGNVEVAVGMLRLTSKLLERAVLDDGDD
jgi:hypothetical protein